MITAVRQKSEHTVLRSLDGARPILLLDLRFVLAPGCLHSGFSILNSGFYCIVPAWLLLSIQLEQICGTSTIWRCCICDGYPVCCSSWWRQHALRSNRLLA